MFTGGHVTAKVMMIESTEGCPIAPGSSLSKEIILSPTAKGHVRVGVRTFFGRNQRQRPAKLDFYEAFAFKVYSHVKIVFKDVFPIF